MSDSFVKWDTYLHVASLSDVGMRRTNNQDNLCVSFSSSFEQYQRRGHLLIVADGMGAHAAGELASKIAVDTIPHLFGKYLDSPTPEALRRAIIDTNTEIHRRGEANQEFYNMGTTCSCLLLLPEGAVAAHVGDSRVYRLRGGILEQLTFDHSLVWEMRASGQLAGKDDFLKIPKNVITRSLGPYPSVNVDLEGPFPIQVGDVYLLCSDGLTGPVADDEIGAILGSLPPNEAAQTLVDIANLRGGPDNSTVIIAKVLHPQLATQGSSSSNNNSYDDRGRIKPWPIVLGLASLVTAAIFLWLLNNIGIAVTFFSFGVICLIWSLVQAVLATSQSSATTASGVRYGRGPYVAVDCSASGWAFIDKLKQMIQEILQVIQDKNWKIDQSRWQHLSAAANQASEQKNLPVAIREYARATIFLMDQLRGQDSAGDTAIDF